MEDKPADLLVNPESSDLLIEHVPKNSNPSTCPEPTLVPLSCLREIHRSHSASAATSHWAVTSWRSLWQPLLWQWHAADSHLHVSGTSVARCCGGILPWCVFSTKKGWSPPPTRDWSRPDLDLSITTWNDNGMQQIETFQEDILFQTSFPCKKVVGDIFQVRLFSTWQSHVNSHAKCWPKWQR